MNTYWNPRKKKYNKLPFQISLGQKPMRDEGGKCPCFFSAMGILNAMVWKSLLLLAKAES